MILPSGGDALTPTSGPFLFIPIQFPSSPHPVGAISQTQLPLRAKHQTSWTLPAYCFTRDLAPLTRLLVSHVLRTPKIKTCKTSEGWAANVFVFFFTFFFFFSTMTWTSSLSVNQVHLSFLYLAPLFRKWSLVWVSPSEATGPF